MQKHQPKQELQKLMFSHLKKIQRKKFGNEHKTGKFKKTVKTLMKRTLFRLVLQFVIYIKKTFHW